MGGTAAGLGAAAGLDAGASVAGEAAAGWAGEAAAGWAVGAGMGNVGRVATGLGFGEGLLDGLVDAPSSSSSSSSKSSALRMRDPVIEGRRALGDGGVDLTSAFSARGGSATGFDAAGVGATAVGVAAAETGVGVVVVNTGALAVGVEGECDADEAAGRAADFGEAPKMSSSSKRASKVLFFLDGLRG